MNIRLSYRNGQAKCHITGNHICLYGISIQFHGYSSFHLAEDKYPYLGVAVEPSE